MTGAPVARAVKFLLGFQNKDGGFELTKGRGSDAQSTAWAIQGLLAAGRKPPHAAFHYLGTMHRPDGSYRYSAQYVTTPVWVTSQVLAALARRRSRSGSPRRPHTRPVLAAILTIGNELVSGDTRTRTPRGSRSGSSRSASRSC